MTTQPMPLEETISSLKSQRESLLEATEIYKAALEDYRSDQEKELIERTIEDLTKRITALESALHHLEAGKDKRYTPQDMIFAASFGIENLGKNFPELKPITPTEPQG